MQRQRHEWKVETDEGTRIYRGTYYGGEWYFMSMLKGRRSERREMEPLEDDEVTDEIWESLREVIFNKYKRNRCPWKMVEEIDKKLGRKSEGQGG